MVGIFGETFALSNQHPTAKPLCATQHIVTPHATATHTASTRLPPPSHSFACGFNTTKRVSGLPHVILVKRMLAPQHRNRGSMHRTSRRSVQHPTQHPCPCSTPHSYTLQENSYGVHECKFRASSKPPLCCSHVGQHSHQGTSGEHMLAAFTCVTCAKSYMQG